MIGRKLAGWPGERWLDVRRVRVLMRIMNRRLDMCAAKGFDAADFDNVDGYANRSGFPLTGKDQLRYDRRLAHAAHARGMSASLKNDLGQIPRLVDDFDFALNEQCLAYRECGAYRPFVSAGKAVFHIEYQGEWPKAKSCEVPGLTSIRARLSLRGYRRPC